MLIVDVHRGVPSTGLRTKMEHADLMQALYGRNGECLAIVLAASTQFGLLFICLYGASRLTLEHMTQFISANRWINGKLRNRSLGNAPNTKSMPVMNPPVLKPGAEHWEP